MNYLRLITLLALLFSGFTSLNAQDDFECPEGEADLVVAAGAVARELELTLEIFDQYMALCPNVNVQALETPALAQDRLGLYIQFLGTRSEAVDIYQIDVIWPAILAEHMVDLYQYAPRDSETIQQHFSPIIDNNTVDGKLVGMPWYTDAGLLYYRTDLLEKYELDVPTTWAELEEAARTIQIGEREEGNTEFWGYVWQGNIGEPITINALEWQASSGGGVIVASDGEIQVNNQNAINAIEMGASWIGEISPPAIIGHTPEDSRDIWQSGNAAFMRNWPYAYNLGNEDSSPIQGLFDVTPLPAGEGEDSIRTGALGGWQLAVSEYSRNPDAAASLVLYMTSPEVQKLRAISGGFAPTIPSLYADPEVLEAAGFFNSLSEALANATARPSTISGSRYSDVTRLYSNAVHSVLRGEEDARTAMEDLEFDLEDLFAQEIQLEDEPESVEASTEEATDTEGQETTVAPTEQPVSDNQDTAAQTTEAEESGIDPVILAGGIAIVLALVVGGILFFRRSSSS